MRPTETTARPQRASLTRQALYEQVWTTPLLRLAPAYGVHHTRLAQLCDNHKIPRPPRGYWVQKAYGKGEPPPGLATVEDAALETVLITPDDSDEQSAAASDPVPTAQRPATSNCEPPAAPSEAEVEAVSTDKLRIRSALANESGLVTLTRRELYDVVWSAPMSQVCQDYNISDVALAKTCKRHHVPSPPRGYWAQLRTGGNVKKPALKPVADPTLEKIEIDRRARSEVVSSTHKEAQDNATAEKKAENKIVVTDNSTELHPLVDRTVKSLTSAKPNERGLVRPRAMRCLEVEVSPAAIDRAGRVMDALVRALESRGHTVAAGDAEGPKTCLTILGEKLSVRLEEEVNCQEKVVSFLERSSEYTYSPSGLLCLRINESAGSGHRRQWSDGQKRLEDVLNAVVVGLVRAAEAIKAACEEQDRRERERKEQERQRQESEKRQRQEAARAQDFEQKLAAWERAGRVRDFVAAARAAAIARDGPIVPGSELDRWFAWALRRADQIDPLTTGRPEGQWPPLEGHAVKLADQGYRNSWMDGIHGTLVLPPETPESSPEE
ncbi:Uncharacterized protein OS=Kordia algicida OT-1 GN=KAOT1_19457 PE=4 SV=1 [Gemmataceae bacterium]|nr:Uncharacterized protein OS=Kordia algicida OT-1 GN=KAOT1_19457 PE=4 SV=1 [Gemmataceae bacterium]VTT98784.1 Uncharacterized protein OS=Kordia algicida OT-1 GN=KAOT1_19457 PE=4 SV=1 [Gemmataceae bacterium]